VYKKILVDDPLRVEKNLHVQMRQYCERNEWFRLDHAALDVLEEAFTKIEPHIGRHPDDVPRNLKLVPRETESSPRTVEESLANHSAEVETRMKRYSVGSHLTPSYIKAKLRVARLLAAR
jgi:hypothetical protein